MRVKPFTDRSIPSTDENIRMTASRLFEVRGASEPVSRKWTRPFDRVEEHYFFAFIPLYLLTAEQNVCQVHNWLRFPP